MTASGQKPEVASLKCEVSSTLRSGHRQAVAACLVRASNGIPASQQKASSFRSIRRRGRAAIQFGGPTSVRFFKIADVLAWECACKSSADQRSIIIAAAITASISATIIAIWRGLLIIWCGRSTLLSICPGFAASLPDFDRNESSCAWSSRFAPAMRS